LEHAAAEIAALGSGAAGLVRIGSVMGPVPAVLTRSLSAFKAANPRVRLSIQVDTSDLLIPGLVRGDLDLVLGRLPDQFEDNSLDVEPFDKGEPMSVIARPQHPLFAKQTVKTADLVALTWLLHPTGSPMRRRVESALQSASMTTALDIVETASILATTALIEVTDMISVVPRDVAQHYARYRLVRIVPLELPIAMAHLGIITRKSKDLSPATQEFLTCLRNTLHPQPRTVTVKPGALLRSFAALKAAGDRQLMAQGDSYRAPRDVSHARVSQRPARAVRLQSRNPPSHRLAPQRGHVKVCDLVTRAIVSPRG
jgi:DNA-binding transcriptional LysR family regulator